MSRRAMCRAGFTLPFRLCVGQTHCLRIKRNASGDSPVKPPPFEHPVNRTLRILKDDMKVVKSWFVNSEKPDTSRKYFPSHTDVVIIGGGIIGTSIAYWLQQRVPNGLNVVVVEKDPTVMFQNDIPSVKYQAASTVLSVGGIRQQFSLKENIEMSLFGAEFLRNIKQHLHVEGHEIPDIQFNPTGYLFLASEKGAAQLEENAEFQQSLGAKNELLQPARLKEKFPWLNTEGIVLGCHGLRNEGWFDPWSLLHAMKSKAVNLGAEFINAEAVGFEFKRMEDMFVVGVEAGQYEPVEKLLVRMPDGEIRSIKFGLAVIAAGANSGNIARMARIGTGSNLLRPPLPVEPRKRYVYCFHCPDGPGLSSPLLVDPTGTYFRREGLGGNYIAGRSPDPDKEPSVDDLEVDYQFFDEHVWPSLAHRVKAFENIKVKSAWAGFYEYNTFDANGIVGLHPYYHNLYIATGFSGHGIQHGPAVGRAVMEMILDGEFRSIDLSRLSFERLLKNEPILENNIW